MTSLEAAAGAGGDARARAGPQEAAVGYKGYKKRRRVGDGENTSTRAGPGVAAEKATPGAVKRRAVRRLGPRVYVDSNGSGGTEEVTARGMIIRAATAVLAGAAGAAPDGFAAKAAAREALFALRAVAVGAALGGDDALAPGADGAFGRARQAAGVSEMSDASGVVSCLLVKGCGGGGERVLERCHESSSVLRESA